MTRRRVAVVGGGLEALQRTRHPDVELVLFHARSGFGFDERMEELCDELVLVEFASSYDRLEKVLLERHDAAPFERIFTLDEDALVSSARLNRLVGAVDNKVLAAWRLKDKALMRRVLAGRVRNPVRFRTVESAEDLRAFVTSVGDAVVVKPVDGSGSVDVHRLADAADAGRVWREVSGRGYRRMLAEEFIAGVEFSVETYSWEGHHVVIGINRKLMKGSLEIGHAIPCSIPESTRAELVDVTVATLDAVGLTHGPAHTELRVNERGAWVIESQNRLAGSRVPELIELAYGIDLRYLSFAIPLGMEAPFTAPPVPNGAAAMRHLLPSPGNVLAVEGLKDIRDTDVRVVIGLKRGDWVRPERTSYDLIDVGSWVVARGRCEEEAVAKCEDALERVHVATTGSPCGAPQPAE